MDGPECCHFPTPKVTGAMCLGMTARGFYPCDQKTICMYIASIRSASFAPSCHYLGYPGDSSRGLQGRLRCCRVLRFCNCFLFSLAHAKYLHQICVAELTCFSLQSFFPLQSVLHLLRTLLFLSLEGPLCVLQLFDLLQ